MKDVFKILFNSFVKRFYKENAGAFLFVFSMMFGIVGKVDGAELLQYHYSIISGLLKSSSFLLLVFFVWFLYFSKCVQFILNAICTEQFSFLHILNSLETKNRIGLFILVELLLFLPVLIYSAFILIIGYREHFYWPALSIICYLLILCISGAKLMVSILAHPYKQSLWLNRLPVFIPPTSYALLLIRFIAEKEKLVWAMLQLFSCSILYLIARNNTVEHYDIKLPFLFYIFGIMANGILIHRIRLFEETHLSFYRGLPVTIAKRLFQYCLAYLVILIPEMITIIYLAPEHLHYKDAINFFLCSYGLLLLMNSISFLQNTGMKEYLKVLLLIYFLQYIFVMADSLGLLGVMLLVTATIFFVKGYSKFETSISRTVQ